MLGGLQNEIDSHSELIGASKKIIIENMNTKI